MTSEDDIEDKNQQPHVDNILVALGPRGKYQILHLFVSSLIVFPACFQLLDNVFIIRKVPHHCAAPSNGSEFWTKYQDRDNVSVSYDGCDIKVSSHGEHISTEKCVEGVEFEWPIEYSVASQFNLVCDHANLAKLAQTLVIGGQGVGAFLITIFSDRFGRKVGLVGSNLGLLVCGLVIAFAPNYIVFAIAKFFTGGFQQGVLTSMNTYTLELFTIKDRRGVVIVGGCLWAVAATSLPLWAYLLRFNSWRYLQVALTLTSLSSFLQLWYLDESLRWLIANGKTKKALKVIQRAAKCNKKDYNSVMKVVYPMKEISTVSAACDRSVNNAETIGTPAKKDLGEEANGQAGNTTIKMVAVEKMSIIDLLRVRRLLINAVSIWFAWFTVALGYFTIYLTATSLHGDPYVNFALVAMMTFPARIFFFMSVNRFGRKTTTITLFGFLGGGLLIVGISNYLEDYNKEVFGVVTLLGSMISMMGAAGSFGAVFFYTPEMFPTNIRNQALGMSSFMGRFGGMLAPFTSVLAEKAVWAPGVLIGCCGIIVCLLIGLILPETKGRELPQTVEELQAWYIPTDSTQENKTKEQTHL